MDGLVNAAGVVSINSVLASDTEWFRRTIDINLIGPYLGIRACAPLMIGRGKGSIVNVSSMQGLTGMPYVSAYVASKFGLRGLTKSVALELGRQGIRCNSVHPGYTDTPMLWANALGSNGEHEAALSATVPLGRVGRAADVAALVLFLLSDESVYCTGAEIAVDGGTSAGFFPPTPIESRFGERKITT
jgi:3alpha(or 20beta)-hydroxysteroid dehydrogenase